MVGNHQDHCRSVLSFGACDCGAEPRPAPAPVKSIPENLRLQHSKGCDWITSNTTKACTCSTPKEIEGVRKPSHYMLFDDVEAIDIIARSMTREQFKGYILGTVLKYRLRAGKKSELAYMEKDLAKAAFFTELYELHKDKCYA